MPFDPLPDLDNANVGMPETSVVYFLGSYRIGDFPFLFARREFMVTINGKVFDVAGRTLSDYLAGTAYDQKRIAVERNGDIVPKAKYAETVLADGDVIEVVSFVGGG